MEGDSLLARKTVFLARGAGRYEVLVAGSSYVYRSFIPTVFDAKLHEAGHDLRSYNFSAPGTYAFEVSHYLDALLRAMDRGRRPRYIIVEVNTVLAPYIVGVMPENRLTTRMIEYHDLGTTLLNLQTLGRSPFHVRQKAAMSAEHLLHLGYRFANVGLVPSLAGARAMTQNERDIVETRAGYAPEYDGRYAQHKDFRAGDYGRQLDFFATRFRQIRAGTRAEKFAPADLYFVQRFFSRLQQFDVEILFLIPPNLYQPQLVFAGPQAAAPLFAGRVLNLGDPDRFPLLYRFENRYDTGHLNHRGAQVFSEALAAEFLALLRGRGTAPH